MLVAAALQTARNAGQKHLSTRVSPWLAAWVRFGFGLPIALIYLVIVLAGFDLPFPPLTGKFLVPALVAALMQIAGTVFLIRLFRLRNLRFLERLPRYPHWLFQLEAEQPRPRELQVLLRISAHVA